MKIDHQCPKCGAPAGHQCIGKRGQERAAVHMERVKRRPWGNPHYAHADISAAEQEQQAVIALNTLSRALADTVGPIWQWGDGNGGYVIATISAELAVHRRPVSTNRATYSKARIGSAMRTAVYERDAYRCVRCDTHVDLSCDHIIPESKGGRTSFDNLQTMCRACNSRKGTQE